MTRASPWLVVACLALWLLATARAQGTYTVANWDRPTRDKVVQSLGDEAPLSVAEACTCKYPGEDPAETAQCAPFPALCGYCEHGVTAMYWDQDAPQSACSQYQEHASDVCLKIGDNVEAQADAVKKRMASLYATYGNFYGASRAVCTEMGCCEGNSDCESEPTGEEEIQWEKCFEAQKVKGMRVISPKQGAGKPCEPEEPEPYKCEEGPCKLKLGECMLDCGSDGLKDLFAVNCPAPNMVGPSGNVLDKCKPDDQKKKDSSKESVMKAAAKLLVPAMQDPDLAGLSVVVGGHASCEGPEQLNQALSWSRASYLRDQLAKAMKDEGAPDAVLGRLAAAGYSYNCPNGADRPKNRRASIYLQGAIPAQGVVCHAPDAGNPGGDGVAGSGMPARCKNSKKDASEEGACEGMISHTQYTCNDKYYCNGQASPLFHTLKDG